MERGLENMAPIPVVKGENKMTELFPLIRIGNKPFYQVGCRRCGKGGSWEIFVSEDEKFRALHPCGYVSILVIVDKPDAKANDMRFFQ